MQLETGVLFAFAAMICWGVGDFLIQRTVRKIGVTEGIAIIGIIGSIGLLPFVWNDLAIVFQPENATLLLGLGFVSFIAAMLCFYAYKVGKLSVIEFVLVIELPITVILATLFFNELLSMEQLIVVGIAFAGIVLISVDSLSLRKSNLLEKGVLVAGMAALFTGVTSFLTASAARNISPILSIWGPWVVYTIISLFWVWHTGKLHAFFTNIRKYRKLVLATGIIDTAAWVFFAIATSTQFLAISMAITESYPAVALLLGVHFNHEQIKGHQLIGGALALAASVVLGFWLV